MKFNVISIFPELIVHYCNESILGRAQAAEIIEVNAIDLRDFADDKHRRVDDTPYGGGAGMVMKPEPVYRALDSLGALAITPPALRAAPVTPPALRATPVTPPALRATPPTRGGTGVASAKTVLLSPRGRQFDERLAEEWAENLKEITFVCGRYEGVDQRVADFMVDEEISVGPYVLAGGELPALVIIEAVSRLIPGVLGNEASLAEETHSMGLPVEYSQYTKPADFNGWTVPEVLMSGNHAEIEKWRKQTLHV